MFTFWYERSYQQNAAILRQHITKELELARINKDENRLYLAQSANDCLTALTEIKHFLYHHKEEPTNQLLKLIIKYYYKNEISDEELNDLYSIVKSLENYLNPNRPSLQKQLSTHQFNYLVWMIASVLFCASLLRCATTLEAIAPTIKGSFCFIVGMEGLCCNASITHKDSIEKIQIFLQLMKDNNQQPNIRNMLSSDSNLTKLNYSIIEDQVALPTL